MIYCGTDEAYSKAMKCKIADIPQGETVELSHEYGAQSLDICSEGLHYVEPILFKGHVRREASSLRFLGALQSRIEQRCARCLRVVAYPIARRIDLVYDTTDRQEIDTTDDMRELLILDHDAKFLCRSDCHGLCPNCGVDLNLDACTCKQGEKLSLFGSIGHVTKPRRQSIKIKNGYGAP